MSKDAILESAAQVIRLKGFHAASMSDIAEAVQLQKASLYHHFSSKQDILVELLNRALTLIIDQMQDVMDMKLPADEKLRLAMRSFLETLSQQGDLVSVLLLEYRSLDPEYLARHVQLRDQYEKMWRELIREGVESGIFAVEDIPMTARGLMGVMNWTITWYHPNGKMSIDEIADHFANVFLNGLKK